MKYSALAALAALLIVVAVWLSPDADPAQAQSGGDIWSNPQNLQVLPSDISSQELRALMVGAATGLGIRCWGCHVGTEEQDLSEFDFVSDEKEMKQLARVMFQMTMDINAGPMAKVAEIEGEEESPRVRCATCHRGEVKPKLD